MSKTTRMLKYKDLYFDSYKVYYAKYYKTKNDTDPYDDAFAYVCEECKNKLEKNYPELFEHWSPILFPYGKTCGHAGCNNFCSGEGIKTDAWFGDIFFLKNSFKEMLVTTDDTMTNVFNEIEIEHPENDPYC